jgi:beta-galactosidase
VHFDFSDAANGVFVTTPQVSSAKATVRVNGKIIQPANYKGLLKVVTTVSDADFKTVATKTTVLSKAVGTEVTIAQELPKIANPHLWAIDDPYLYHIATQVYDNSTKELLDQVTNPLGFRWVKFDAEKGFFLNDKPIKLIGTSRHQDFPGLGNALPESYHIADMKLLKEMGGNFLRIAHYPQDPAILESCDRLGILATIEIPIVNAITESDAFYSNSKQMQLEMIHQNFNHPALIVWGYMNEILLRPKFAGNKPRQQEYFANIAKLAQQLEDLTRKEDPGRYTMMADHGAYDSYKNVGLLKIPMLVGWNLYSGWYSGVTSDFGKFLDKFHKEFPDKPMMVTEFGADADPRIRALKPEKFDKSIEYAVNFHRVYLDAILERPFVTGAMVWNLADFNSESREETMPHINNKGLLTQNREPKDTYRFYQAKLLTKPFIKISDWKARTGIGDSTDNTLSKQAVTVFTNAASVQLMVNHNKLPIAKTDDGMAVYLVPFANGLNNLEAVAIIDGKEYRDQVNVNFDLQPYNFKSAQTFRQINVLLGARHIYIEPVTKTVWQPDQVYKAGQFGHTGGKFYGGTNNRLPYGSDRNIRNTDNDPVYQTQQVGITRYQLDVAQGEYELTLHFAELVSDEKKEALIYNLDSHIYNEKSQERIFDVLVNGKVMLKDFNVAQKYGYLTAGYERMKISVNDARGILIEFKPIKGEPILNALQLSKVY